MAHQPWFQRRLSTTDPQRLFCGPETVSLLGVIPVRRRLSKNWTSAHGTGLSQVVPQSALRKHPITRNCIDAAVRKAGRGTAEFW